MKHRFAPVHTPRQLPGIPRHGIAGACLLASCCAAGAAADQSLLSNITAPPAELQTLDFRYSPPQWQTAICLPDDPQKSLVDEHGALLYHYGTGGNDFATRVAVEVPGVVVWENQQLVSPRVPIVRTCRTTEGWRIVEEAFAATSPAGGGPPRNDLILVRVSNTGTTERTLAPRLCVDTKLDFKLLGQHVVVNKHETISCSLGMSECVKEGKSRRVIQLESITVMPGASTEFFVCYSGGTPVATAPATVQEVVAARDLAIAWWRRVPLPYDRILVPDAGIQGLLDASIRNIWQAREIKNGMTAFQVGPSCYRGLWLIDGAFLLETATMLGSGAQARSGIDYELTNQQPDGRIELMNDFSKENGVVLWTCCRHARLTQDKTWLESVWPRLQRIAEYIKTLRRQTLTNDTPLDDGLNPPGMPDGGIGGVFPEYTNPCWNLLGLRSFIDAARWLGKTDEAAVWQLEYDDFMAAFRKTAARDMRQDTHGNTYLPVLMGAAGTTELPQRAQWSFCHAVYPGQIFERADPLVAGNLAMLAATEREGMVYGTGWDPAGIWTYFASFYAHARLWQGDGRAAAAALYAFANHSAPLLEWREEQSLTGAKFRKVGDMPHNWAGAEFIRLTVHLLALERGDQLHLLEGLPSAWTKPGMRTRLAGIATQFGPLTMALEIAEDGRTASLHVEPLAGDSCAKIVVHPSSLSNNSNAAALELDPRQRHDLTIQLVPLPTTN